MNATINLILDSHLALADSFTGIMPSSSKQLCVFFARGYCRNGSTCRFVHKLPGVNSIVRSSSQGGAHLGSTQDPDMGQCSTLDELGQTYDHLDTISPRGIAAFWSLFVKHLHNHYETSQCKLIEQLNAILYNTLENMKGYGYRDIATIAISLAKIMKQVES